MKFTLSSEAAFRPRSSQVALSRLCSAAAQVKAVSCRDLLSSLKSSVRAPSAAQVKALKRAKPGPPADAAKPLDQPQPRSLRTYFRILFASLQLGSGGAQTPAAFVGAKTHNIDGRCLACLHTLR